MATTVITTFARNVQQNAKLVQMPRLALLVTQAQQVYILHSTPIGVIASVQMLTIQTLPISVRSVTLIVKLVQVQLLIVSHVHNLETTKYSRRINV